MRVQSSAPTRSINIRVARNPQINPDHFTYKTRKSMILLNITSPSTALAQTKTGKFFYHGEGYRYSLTADKFKLMLQCKREVFDKFRTSRVGRKAMELVDVFEQGHGWYEVTSQDFSNFEAIDGVRRNGLIVWLRVFNQFSSNPIEVHVIADPVTSVETPPAYVDEALLAERDEHIRRFQLRVTMKKPDRIVRLEPVPLPRVGTITAQPIQADPRKLAALAAMFKKH